MKIHTICTLSLLMLTLTAVSGLRTKKQAGICAAAGVPDVSTTTVVDTVGEVTENPREIDDILHFVEENTVATHEEVAVLVNEVAKNAEEAHELTELIEEVVHVVEAEETQLSTHDAVEAATGVVEGHENVEVIIDYIHETTVATPEEIQEIVEQVTSNHHQAEELTEVLDSTIQVVYPPTTDVFQELHEEVIHNDLPPVEVREVTETVEYNEEIGEETHIDVVEPVYYEGEREVEVEREEQIPYWDMPGYNGGGIPPEVHEEINENGEVTYWAVDEPLVYYSEETGYVERSEVEIFGGEGSLPPQEERVEILGGNGHGLPPVWTYEGEATVEYPDESGQLPPVTYETVEATREIVEDPVAVEEVITFIHENPEATPEEVAELAGEVTNNHQEAEELAELIAEHVNVQEDVVTEVSTVGIEEAAEIVHGRDATEQVVNFLEETTAATPEEIAEFVAEVTTNHHQAEALTEVIYDTVEIYEEGFEVEGAPVEGEGQVQAETLPFPLPTPVIDDTPAFCHA